MVKVKKLTVDDVEFKIHVHPEHIPVQENAIDSGDETYDREIEDNIIERLNNGDIWAWCTVEVQARYDIFKGEDFLGCCSYSDQEEFEADEYFGSMKQQALEDLNEEIQNIAEKIFAIGIEEF
jgi:hypothetical protein